jgi:hypothetical protein
LSFWVREERGTEEERESDKDYTEISLHLLFFSFLYNFVLLGKRGKRGTEEERERER